MKYLLTTVALVGLFSVASAQADEALIQKTADKAPVEQVVAVKETTPSQKIEEKTAEKEQKSVEKPTEVKELGVMGDDKAPLKMYVFSSLTCSHCAVFYTKILPELKKEYIDKGLVQLTYVDMPFDRRALAGAMISHCVAPSRYFDFINVLYSNQENWAFQKDAQKIVMGYASLEGLSKEDVKKCLSNQKTLRTLISKRDEMIEKYDVMSTPSFVLIKGDETRKVIGADKNKLFKKINTLFKDR